MVPEWTMRESGLDVAQISTAANGPYPYRGSGVLNLHSSVENNSAHLYQRIDKPNFLNSWPHTLSCRFRLDPNNFFGPALFGLSCVCTLHSADGTILPGGYNYEPILDLSKGSDDWGLLSVDFFTGAADYIEVRLHCPWGSIWYDEVALNPHEAIPLFDVDQQEIAWILVEHAQDTRYHGAFAPLNITRGTAADTGVRRSKVYDFKDKANIENELQALAGDWLGFDYGFEFPNATTRQFKVYYPRKGTYKPQFSIEDGRWSSSYNYSEDGEETYNAYIAIGQSEVLIPPGYAADPAELGVLLENTITSESSDPKALDSLAYLGVVSRKNLVKLLTATCKDPDGVMAAGLWDGDSIKVRYHEDGFDIDNIYRVMRKTWDPTARTVALSLSLDPIYQGA